MNLVNTILVSICRLKSISLRVNMKIYWVVKDETKRKAKESLQVFTRVK